MGKVKVYTKGALDVYIQDQTSNLIDYYMPIPKEVLSLAEIPVLDSYEIVLEDASNVIVGDYIVIKEGRRAFQPEVLSISGNTLTLDTPNDYEFSLDAIVESRSIELNVDGSVAPVIADFAPPFGAIIDVNMVNFNIIDETVMDDAKFGGMAALTRGLILRKSADNKNLTIFNAKTNSQLSQRARLAYSDRAPSGFYGLRGTKYMNGPEGNGVAIRLNGYIGESLQVVIQDDLTPLTSFQMTVRGHIVDDY